MKEKPVYPPRSAERLAVKKEEKLFPFKNGRGQNPLAVEIEDLCTQNVT